MVLGFELSLETFNSEFGSNFHWLQIKPLFDNLNISKFDFLVKKVAQAKRLLVESVNMANNENQANPYDKKTTKEKTR